VIASTQKSTAAAVDGEDVAVMFSVATPFANESGPRQGRSTLQ
jgi:hypothetical protein